jgi:hypothetical protein
MVARDLETAIQHSHDAVVGIFRGDAPSVKVLFSDRNNITLGNPFEYARGRSQVEETLDRAASNYRDGELTGAELIATYVSADLACVVEVERGRAKVGASGGSPTRGRLDLKRVFGFLALDIMYPVPYPYPGF